jgi:hypothetical protein
MHFCPPDDGGGGGGGDDKDKDKNKDKSKGSVSKEEFDELKAQHSKLMENFEKLMKSKSKDRDGDDDVDDEDEKDDEDLRARARKSRDRHDKNENDTKALEAALRFNMGAEQWLKDNASLLPKEIADIFNQAKKENYSNAIERDAAIKAGIVQSFFDVQANLDLLTPALKSVLEDYKKLTKDGKHKKAREIYDMVFEPAFERLKDVTKAKALSKGHGDNSDDAYKKRLIAGSRKHFLGEKENA